MRENFLIAIVSGISVGLLLKYVCHFHHPLWAMMSLAFVGSFITTFVVNKINR